MNESKKNQAGRSTDPERLTTELIEARAQGELLDLVYDAVLVRDIEDRVIRWNQGATEIYGWSAAEAQGRVSHGLLRTIFPQPLANIKACLFATGRWQGQLRQATRAGREVYVASRWALRRDQEGRPTVILEINTDVTERVLAEKALQESEERYRRLFEDDLTGDYLATPEAQILACNPAFLELFGFTDLSQALQTSLIELRRDPEEWTTFLDRLKSQGRLKHHQSVMRRSDGQEVYVVENAVGVLDRAGRLLQIKGYLFDDTERQRSERLLQEAEERYRLLVEMIPDAVLVSDAQSVRFVNPAMARLMGVESSADLVGRPLLELFHPEDHAEITRRSELALSGQGPWPPDRRRLVRLDGRLVAVESTVAPCLFDGQPAILRVNRDITERVKAEEELLRKDKEISQHARRVEELNTALSVLLEHRELENRQKEDLVRATLTKLILPHLATLQATRLDEEQQTAVELLEANLARIMTSLSAGPLAWQEKLTPTELQVAELLRLGKRTKEIAAFLKISPSAVAFHRANIRHKLGLTHRRVNLVAHLSGLEERRPAQPELTNLSRSPGH